jgi:uncharacterized protein YbjT (DUF2867 family)
MSGDAPIPAKVLLFGATGVIGKPILDQLVEAKSSFEKIGIFTSPGTADKKRDELDKLRGEGIDVVVGDVNDEEDVKKAYQGRFKRVDSSIWRPSADVNAALQTPHFRSQQRDWFP